MDTLTLTLTLSSPLLVFGSFVAFSQLWKIMTYIYYWQEAPPSLHISGSIKQTKSHILSISYALDHVDF